MPLYTVLLCLRAMSFNVFEYRRSISFVHCSSIYFYTVLQCRCTLPLNILASYMTQCFLSLALLFLFTTLSIYVFVQSFYVFLCLPFCVYLFVFLNSFNFIHKTSYDIISITTMVYCKKTGEHSKPANQMTSHK